VLSLSKRLAENQGRILMKILDKDEAWTIYNEFFKDDDVLKVNELKWEDAADLAIDASCEASKHLNEFNNLYGLLMEVVLECEKTISSDDEIEHKASYLSQLASMYEQISPEELRLWYAEGRFHKDSDNNCVELTVKQTKFIVLMGSVIYENVWLALRLHNEGKEE
jgi:hypothetical protein